MNAVNNTITIDPGFISAFIGVMVVLFVIALIVLLLEFIGKFRVLRKMGYKGWECIVPFYGD